MYEDDAAEWRWRLVAGNGRIIADSGEGYKNVGDCLKGIRLVMGTAKVPIKRDAPRPKHNALARALAGRR
jgi:uncharacterized protein YegP (UPF0339 family)